MKAFCVNIIDKFKEGPKNCKEIATNSGSVRLQAKITNILDQKSERVSLNVINFEQEHATLQKKFDMSLKTHTEVTAQLSEKLVKTCGNLSQSDSKYDALNSKVREISKKLTIFCDTLN